MGVPQGMGSATRCLPLCTSRVIPVSGSRLSWRMWIKTSIRGTYNHAQYFEGRREMLQWYADYLDSFSSGYSEPKVIAVLEKVV